MTPVYRARYEFMRRQHEAGKSGVLHRAAQKMQDAHPNIAVEFADLGDDDLYGVVMSHVDDYIREALEQ